MYTMEETYAWTDDRISDNNKGLSAGCMYEVDILAIARNGQRNEAEQKQKQNKKNQEKQTGDSKKRALL